MNEEYCLAENGHKLCNREPCDDCLKSNGLGDDNNHLVPTLREYAAMVFEKSTGLPDPNGRMPAQLTSKSEGKPISFYYQSCYKHLGLCFVCL